MCSGGHPGMLRSIPSPAGGAPGTSLQGFEADSDYNTPLGPPVCGMPVTAGDLSQ
jgi:hypothetical protein